VNTNLLQVKLLIYYQVKFPLREKMEIVDFQELNTGSISDVYSYTLTYEMNQKTYSEPRVLKLYVKGIVGADRALKERHALRNLHEEGFPVPGSTLVEVDEAHLGGSFVIMERIEGQSLWEAIERADEERRRELMGLFSGLLADLHSLHWEVLVPNLKINDEYTLIKREIYNLKQSGSEIQPVVEWLHARRDLVPCKRPTITHRDYHPHNVIITDAGVYEGIIIDWGWQISDPRFDLGWTLTALERSELREFRDDVLAEYERQRGEKVEQLEYFEVLASAYWLMHNVQALKNLQNGRRAALTANIRKATALIYDRSGIELPDVEALLA
jgi:aminoglycoside phosphotransferase (APT) family kinase protein